MDGALHQRSDENGRTWQGATKSTRKMPTPWRMWGAIKTTRWHDCDTCVTNITIGRPPSVPNTPKSRNFGMVAEWSLTLMYVAQ